MRVGIHPNKKDSSIKSNYFHQVIIPVYIPNNEGYFKDAFKILKLSIKSLLASIHSRTYITVIDNGSSSIVYEYLVKLKLQHQIQELISLDNVGKINALFKGISGHKFKLITLAHADVLYLPHWQKETYSIFETFSAVGVVCPTPSSKSYLHNNQGLLLRSLLNKDLYFKDIKNPQDLKDFAHSIGNKDFYNKYQLEQFLVLKSHRKEVVIGAGHYVATYNGELLYKLDLKNTNVKMGQVGMSRFDNLSRKYGYLRLATTVSYAQHMGNVYENWMNEKLKNESEKVCELTEPQIKQIGKTSLFIYAIFNKIGSHIFKIKSFKYWYLRIKGLNPLAIKQY
jgi:hypothetical protein